jgi:hypothetical protein
MDSEIGLPISVGAACLISSLYFWYTYRNQVEPVGGRGSQEYLEAMQVAEIQREIHLEVEDPIIINIVT